MFKGKMSQESLLYDAIASRISIGGSLPRRLSREEAEDLSLLDSLSVPNHDLACSVRAVLGSSKAES
ncbi:MAG: hypothetical protein AAGM67_17100, partial [Bacteroidota bacterium]